MSRWFEHSDMQTSDKRVGFEVGQNVWLCYFPNHVAFLKF